MGLLDDPTYRLMQANIGFLRARERCDRHPENVDLDVIFLDLTEALWWSRCVDEGIKDAVGGKYEAARDADWSGGHVLGMRLPRNSASHQQALTVTDAEDLHHLPFPLSMRKRHVIWRPLAEIRFGIKPARNVARAYEERLAGNPVTASLNAARDWFGEAMRVWPEAFGVRVWTASEKMVLRKEMSGEVPPSPDGQS